MPPIITMKIENAVQFTVKAASGECAGCRENTAPPPVRANAATRYTPSLSHARSPLAFRCNLAVADGEQRQALARTQEPVTSAMDATADSRHNQKVTDTRVVLSMRAAQSGLVRSRRRPRRRLATRAGTFRDHPGPDGEIAALQPERLRTRQRDQHRQQRGDRHRYEGIDAKKLPSPAARNRRARESLCPMIPCRRSREQIPHHGEIRLAGISLNSASAGIRPERKCPEERREHKRHHALPGSLSSPFLLNMHQASPNASAESAEDAENTMHGI